MASDHSEARKRVASNFLEEFLQPKLVRWCHDKIIEMTGGVYGENNPGGVDSVIGRIKSWVEYEQIENVLLIAVFISWSFARGHAFTDGNKRTGYIFMSAFLEHTGYEMKIKDNNQLAAIMERSAKRDITLEQFYNYMSKRVEPVDNLEFLLKADIGALKDKPILGF